MSTMPEAPTAGGRGSRRAWGAVIALAVVARIAWALAVSVVPISDSGAYDTLARSLARGDGYSFKPGEPTAFWPVGTSAFYALLYRTFGVGYGPIVAVNVAVGATTVLLVMLLARHWFGDRAATAAGAILAVWPGQLQFTTVLASELLFNVAYVAGLAALVLPGVRPAGRVLAGGVALAAASYVRPIALPLPAVIAWVNLAGAWAAGAWSWRRTVAILVESAGVVAIMAALIAPWTLRNDRLLGHPVLIATNGGVNLWVGNHPGTDGFYTSPPARVDHVDEVKYEALLGREATDYIRAHPGAFMLRTIVKILRIHERESIGVVWNAPGLERTYGRGVLMPLKIASLAYWWAALALALAGAAVLCLRLGPMILLTHPAPVLWIYFALLHGVIVAADRYHYPSVPVIAALAGLGFVSLCDRLTLALGRPAGPIERGSAIATE